MPEPKSITSRESLNKHMEEEEDYYDEDLHIEHQLTHKLKGPQHQRESIFNANCTFGSNSDLDKTMSAMGGTFRLGVESTFK